MRWTRADTLASVCVALHKLASVCISGKPKLDIWCEDTIRLVSLWEQSVTPNLTNGTQQNVINYDLQALLRNNSKEKIPSQYGRQWYHQLLLFFQWNHPVAVEWLGQAGSAETRNHSIKALLQVCSLVYSFQWFSFVCIFITLVTVIRNIP